MVIRYMPRLALPHLHAIIQHVYQSALVEFNAKLRRTLFRNFAVIPKN
jgi:hypothetical protein